MNLRPRLPTPSYSLGLEQWCTIAIGGNRKWHERPPTVICMEGSVLGAVRNDVVVPFEAWEKSAPTKRPNSGHEALRSTTNMKHGKVQGAFVLLIMWLYKV